ncbi:deoxynucleoside kinase [Ruminiclostridium herbifermentans]|uniref:Deoxynucleoside kinase n=1 Tax=Ruminiclostridium herbifermentans TaxID=2488810 RepID=A0A4U7JHH9_9FIRM|nr:deoxynucleoside kinase [Ruminiclostridium herbifermentans]QNU66160.1 deoxynucleoside kinase [Ruminiclostridium herbifermentans]
MNKYIYKTNTQKGVLIAFEGISGSGKSESITKIYNHLSKQNNVQIVEWNSNEKIRSFIKVLCNYKVLTSTIYSILQWISFFIDYFTRILPALNKGNIVIADRYVYTALTRDIVNGAKVVPSKYLCSLVRKPDILFFYDTNCELCYERILTRGKALFHTNKYIKCSKLLKNKNLYYLKKLRGEYIKLLQKSSIIGQTNVVIVKNDELNVIKILDQYLKLKYGENFKSQEQFIN